MEKIGKYRITAQIGRGGFGRVYRAYDPAVGREVAIKVLADAGDEQAAMVARFKVEASAAGSLQHKNIVTIFEYGEHEGMPYLVMEYLNGQDLHHVLRNRRSLTLLDKLSIMAQVAEGLNHAHLHGIVHRDVKPGNIMVLKDGGVKIMDFGIARLTRDHGTRLTQTGMLMGTVPYMAPEQFSGGQVDHLTDIFAYGVIFYELVTGTHPFRPPQAAITQVMYNIGTLDPPPVSSVASDCPAALDAVLIRTLHKEREQRYQSLEDVMIDLAPIQMDLQAAFASQHLQTASRLLEEGQLEEASSIIRDVLRRDPSNRTARQLRDSLQGQAKRQTRERSRRLADAGRREIEAGNYPEAMRLLEEAHRLDTANTDASVLLEQAREAIERHKRAADLVERAKVKYAADDLTGAYQNAMEALSLAPGSQPASALVTNIRREMEERERRRALRQDVDRVRELVAGDSFDEALSVLDQLQTAYPESRTLRQLQQEIRAKQEQHRREQKRLQVAQARRAISEGRHGDAASALARLARDHPGDAEVQALQVDLERRIEEKKKAERIAAALERAENSARASRFEEARGCLHSALETDPAEPSLVAMLERIAATERREAVRSAIEQAEQMAPKKQYAAALACLDEAIARWGSEELAPVRARLDREREQHERSLAVANAVRKARQFLDRDNPQAAVDSLRQALESYPDAAELSSLLETSESRLAAKKKAERIGAIVERAQAHLRARAFEQALEEIGNGLREFPHEPELDLLREEVREAQLAACRAGARSLLDAGRFQEAADAAESALGLFPGDALLRELRDSAREARARQRREQAIAAALKQACVYREQGKIDAAISILENEEKQSGSSEDMLLLLSLLRQERAEQQRQAALEQIGGRARRLAEQNDYGGAIEVLRAGLQEFPSSAELEGQLQETRRAQFEHEQREAARRAAEAFREAEEKGDWIGIEQTLQLTLEAFPENDQIQRMLDDARRARRQSEISELQAEIEDLVKARNLEDAELRAEIGAQDYPEEPGLAALAERIAQQRQRRDDIRQCLSQARALLDDGDAEGAVRSLDRALDRYPAEPELAAFREAAKEALHARRRAAFIEDALRNAGELIRSAQPEKAVPLLETALGRYPDVEEIAALLDSAKEAVSARRRAAFLEAAQRKARALVDGGQPEKAVPLLQETLDRYPDAEEVAVLLDTANTAISARRRAASIEDALNHARELLDTGQPAQAVAGLEAALDRYPDAEEISRLLDSARERAAAAEREAEVARSLSSAGALADQSRFAEAIDELERARARYPDEASLERALGETRGRKARFEREAAIQAACSRAQAALDRNKPTDALSILAASLATYPGEPALLDLRSRAEQMQREEEQALARRRAAYFGDALNHARELLETGQPAHAVTVLEAALGRYPDADEISRLLDSARERAAAAERAAEVARSLSSAGALADQSRFAEAITELERARARYPDEASLEQALGETRERKARFEREAAIQAACSRAQAALDRSQPADALSILAASLATYPDEPALLDLRSRAEQMQREEEEALARRRAAYLGDALNHARELLETGQPAQAVAVLEGALDRYPDADEISRLLDSARDRAAAAAREADIARSLSSAGALADQSRFAEAIDELQRALGRYPGEPALQKALRETEERKARFEREAAIQAACSRARGALDKGKPADALSILAGSLAAYPGEPALLDLQGRAERLQQEQEKALARRRDLQALKELPKAVKSARTLAELDTLEQRLEVLLAAYPEDADFSTAANALRPKLDARRTRLTPAAVPAGSVAEAPRSYRKFVIPGAAAAALLLALGIWFLRTPTPSGTGLVIASNPPGATIRIGDGSCTTPECRFDLESGTYELEASLEGYRPVKRSVELPGAPNPLRLDLEPLPTRVVISSNLESGSVLLDGRPAGSLEHGRLAIDSVAGGRHRLEIKGAGSESARVEFEVTPGRMPALTGPAQSSEVQVLAVGQLGKKASLISDGKPKTVSALNRNLGTLGPAPIAVEDLPDATIDVALAEGSRSWTYALQPSAEPALAVFLSANRDTGVLLVESEVPGADVLIDGRVAGQTAASGRLELPLRTGAYRLSLAKAGYDASPAARVAIERDSVRRVAPQLTPREATLALNGVLPGTELAIDGRTVQTVSGNARLRVPPGQRSIELRKEGYRPVRLARQFEPGATVTLGPPDVTLTELPKAKPEPPPRDVEGERWEIARNATDIGVLEQFRRDFPASPRAAEAQARIEQLEWQAARARNDAAALQAFLARYPNSSHRAEAEQIAARIAWERLDRSSLEGLRAFAKQYPQYAQQALAEIARLEQEGRGKADAAAIQQTLNRLIEAFGRKNFQEVASVWPSAPASFRNNFREAREVTLILRPTSPLRISGDTASLTCEWTFDARFPDQRKAVPLPATINLVRRSTDWSIQSIQFQ